MVSYSQQIDKLNVALTQGNKSVAYSLSLELAFDHAHSACGNEDISYFRSVLAKGNAIDQADWQGHIVELEFNQRQAQIFATISIAIAHSETLPPRVNS